MEEWLTVDQAAELSGYHPNHIRRLIRSGGIMARKFGPVWQVSRTAVLDYLRDGAQLQDRRRGPKK